MKASKYSGCSYFNKVVVSCPKGTSGDKRNTPDQEVLIDLAKDAKNRGGLTYDEADILFDWADEYNVPHHGPETHPDRPGPFSKIPHIHIGKQGHIPVH